MKRFITPYLSLLLAIPVFSIADTQADVAAIEALLRQYRATQDAGDLLGQSKLMALDRVWINAAGVRRTDNAENMCVQQAQAEAEKKRLPGLQSFTMDRDVLIKFYAEGKTAIVSFYRNAERAYPPGTSSELISQFPPSEETGTLVLEKQKDGAWLIVHTHWSGHEQG